MQWICLAERPLSLTELRFALASDDLSIHRFQESAQQSTGFVESDTRMKDMTIALSGGLAEVKFHHGGRIVQFIHQSVNDFLLKEGFRWLDQNPTGDAIGRGHDRLSKSCINYLKLGEVQCTAHSTLWDRSTMTENLPFLLYATESWFLHAQKAERLNIPQRDLIQRFQWPSAQYFSHWIEIFIKMSPYKYNSMRPLRQTTLMHVAAASDLESILRALLESGTPLEAEDDEGDRALHCAARWGHKGIINILLDAGANVDAKNLTQSTPLERAAAGGHEEVVEILLERGAEVNYQTGNSGSALQSAALKGSLVAVKLLLDRGADIQAQGGQYGNALQAAAYRGHENIVKILTKKLADVNKEDFQGRLALHFAMRGNQPSIMQYFLSIGAMANWTYTDQQGCSALHFAASGGSVQAVRLVISSGIDVNISDTNGWTPLHWACRNGDVDTVRLLMDSGANLHSKNMQGQTPLDVAIFCNNGSLIPILSPFDGSTSQISLASATEHNAYCNSCLHVSRVFTSLVKLY
jgi:ankyrin repeat protein